MLSCQWWSIFLPHASSSLIVSLHLLHRPSQWVVLWTYSYRAWLLSRLRAPPCLQRESMHGAVASGCLYILALCDMLNTRLSYKWVKIQFWCNLISDLGFATTLCSHGNREASWVFSICVAICLPEDAWGRRHGETVKRALSVNKHRHKCQVFHVVQIIWPHEQTPPNVLPVTGFMTNIILY